MALALGAAVAGVSAWWLLMMTPETVEVTMEALEVEVNEPDVSSDVLDGDVAVAVDDDADWSAADAASARETVTGLLATRETNAAIGFAQTWLERQPASDARAKVLGEYLLECALAGAQRLDEAEVHFMMAQDYGRELGPRSSGLLDEIAVALNEFNTVAEGPVVIAEPVLSREGATIITVSLQRDFQPSAGGMSIGATPSWLPMNNRLEEFPLFELSESSYQGTHQLYGALKLGTTKEALFSFVFDVPVQGDPVVWFDRNTNYDLTDAGSVLENHGNGVFATEVALPLNAVLPSYLSNEDFRIWFFPNDSL